MHSSNLVPRTATGGGLGRHRIHAAILSRSLSKERHFTADGVATHFFFQPLHYVHAGVAEGGRADLELSDTPPALLIPVHVDVSVRGRIEELMVIRVPFDPLLGVVGHPESRSTSGIGSSNELRTRCRGQHAPAAFRLAPHIVPTLHVAAERRTNLTCLV